MVSLLKINLSVKTVLKIVLNVQMKKLVYCVKKPHHIIGKACDVCDTDNGMYVKGI